MADKEPRRRRKRKDVSRKDEALPFESHASTSHGASANTRDSDQDIDEEPAAPVPSHEPSRMAQIVFIILSIVLVAAMCFVFVALQGSPKTFEEDELQIAEPFHAILEPVIPVADIELNDDLELEAEDIASENLVETEPEHEMFADDQGDTSSLPSIDSSEMDVIEDPLPANTYEPDIDENLIQFSDSDTLETEDPEVISSHDIPDHLDIPSAEAATIESPDVLPKDIPDIEAITSSDGAKPEEAIEVTLVSGDSPAAKEAYVTTEAANIASAAAPATTEAPMPALEAPDVGVVVEKIATTDRLNNEIPDLNNEDYLRESILGDNDDDVEDDELDQVHQEDLVYRSYEKADITNKADYEIREELDSIEKTFEKNPEAALQMYESLLRRHPQSPRGLYGKATTLDRLAELQQSNKVLEQAISIYQEVMVLNDVPGELQLRVGKRCAARMQFRGLVGKSLKVLIGLADKFPQDVDLQNKIAVGYLLIGQNLQAKKVLTNTIEKHPDNGFAKVHLGFILKTDDSNYKDAIPLLTEGIASREEGVLDGRFFFHLGDALARLGKTAEAMKVYEEGVKEKLFLSTYQRSLYNVDGLTGKPWWNPKVHRYSHYFEMLEKNWVSIKAEALALTGKFAPESEGLQDRGEWEQFELFVRGRKVTKNCAAVPFTCSVIEQMPDAATCKRGQVKFSVMKPGTHVWAHTGPTNCRLRAHLGLVVPDGVRIRVANETRTWENGKVILFDDSFEHEVWHDGSSPRLVLIVDFWHPELTPKQKASLSPI